MRHRLGLRKAQPHQQPSSGHAAEHDHPLLRHETITTTLPKAKELRRVAEPIITLGKKPSLANRRLAFNRLRDREMVIAVRPAGPAVRQSQRRLPAHPQVRLRRGDNAPMALVELLDKPEVKEDGKAAK
jgi:large subunit ribosomal protein L17